MLDRIRLLLLRLAPGPVLRLVEGFWTVPLLTALLGIAMLGEPFTLRKGSGLAAAVCALWLLARG